MDLKRMEKSIVHLKCYSEDKQDFGTALYVKKGNKQYLITVKHLIVNRNSGKLHESIIKANKYAENLKTVGVDQIYRLGSGESGEAPVVYENNHFEMDLAIISLNFNETIEFKRNLESSDYTPLDFKHISDKKLTAGDDLCLIGYPDFSDLGVVNPMLTNQHLPIYSFGKVSLFHNDLNYFMGNMFSYGGFSGGPIIYNNKVVGINTAQIVNYINCEKEEQPVIKYPMNYIIKGDIIFSLMKEIESNESQHLHL
ncbi:serine protease [Bacillus sp. FSL P4-0334]|uniref:S1 family peptidase n=1 Tax=Bacillus sp. FSL P4-0334 TaxID=2954520 RepID=UPI0030FA8013